MFNSFFNIIQFLFERFYPIYKPLYFFYKKKKDSFELSLIKNIVRNGNVVFDIGANIGFYSSFFSKYAGKHGQVYSFEPDSLNFSYLLKGTFSIPTINIFNTAIGPQKDTISFYKSKSLNVDHRTYKPDHFAEETKVNMTSIDHFCSEHAIDKIDFIKIDIQGYEMQAMLGAKFQLEKNRGIKILSEFWPYGLKKSGSSVLEYFDFLIQLEFQVFLLDKSQLLPLYRDQVLNMVNLPEENYFNIYAYRNV